jgi:calcium-binding protein CML
MNVLNEFVSKQCLAIMAPSQLPVLSSTMRQRKNAFDEVDRNGDGFISKDELRNVIMQFGMMISNEELETMIELADSDGNGLVDFTEFSNLMDNYCLDESSEQKLENLFSVIDVNKDGYLSESEIANMLKRLGEKVRRKDVRKMIREADKDKDGLVSFHEFKDFANRTNFLLGLK